MKIITVLIALFLPVIALAAQNQNGQATATSQTQNQNSNQDQTQTQDRLQSPTASETPLQVRNLQSQERGNAVSEAAQNLIEASYQITNKGIGDQIRTIAQTQVQDMNQVNKSIDIADQRSAITKFFIGPNYKELKIAKELRDQNVLRITQLEQLALQVEDGSEEMVINNAVATLEAENSSLGGQIDIMASGFSLFGWLNRLIYGYQPNKF